MAYVALTRLKVGHDETTDTPVYRMPGEAVPEAEAWDWRTRQSYEKNGHIRFVPDTTAPKRTAKG